MASSLRLPSIDRTEQVHPALSRRTWAVGNIHLQSQPDRRLSGLRFSVHPSECWDSTVKQVITASFLVLSVSCLTLGYGVSSAEPSDPTTRELVAVTDMLKRCTHSHIFLVPPLLCCVYLSWCWFIADTGLLIAGLIALYTSQATESGLFFVYFIKQVYSPCRKLFLTEVVDLTAV